MLVQTIQEYNDAVAAEEIDIVLDGELDVDALPDHPCKVSVLGPDGCLLIQGVKRMCCALGVGTIYLNGYEEPEDVGE